MHNTHETNGKHDERNGINVHYYGKVVMETVQYQNDGRKEGERQNVMCEMLLSCISRDVVVLCIDMNIE